VHCSNITLLAWVIYYWVLVAWLKGQSWELQDWDAIDPLVHDKLNSIRLWSTAYRWAHAGKGWCPSGRPGNALQSTQLAADGSISKVLSATWRTINGCSHDGPALLRGVELQQ
jgi:hypothetical protein